MRVLLKSIQRFVRENARELLREQLGRSPSTARPGPARPPEAREAAGRPAAREARSEVAPVMAGAAFYSVTSRTGSSEWLWGNRRMTLVPYLKNVAGFAPSFAFLCVLSAW